MNIFDNLDLTTIQIDIDNVSLETVMDEKKLYAKKNDLSADRKKRLDNAYDEVMSFTGLIALSEKGTAMRQNLVNMRNKKLEVFWFTKYEYHKEMVIQQFYGNDPEAKMFSVQLIMTSDERIKTQTIMRDKFPIGSAEYNKWQKVIDSTKRTTESARRKIKYITKSESSTWQPPKFEEVIELAKKKNIHVSDAIDIFERERLYFHLVPDWIVEMCAYYNYIDSLYSPMVEKEPRQAKYLTNAKNYLLKYNNANNHAKLMFDALDKYWSQAVFGVKAIEDGFLDQTIMNFVNGTQQANVALVSEKDTLVSSAMPMGGFFDVVGDIFNVVMTPARLFAKSFKKIVLDNTLGRVLPEKYYSILANLTDAQINILSGKLSKKEFQAIVEAAKSISTIGLKIGDELMRVALRVGPIQDLDRASGGLLTSVKHLNKVPITLVHDPKGFKKIDWGATAFDVVKVGLAVASGGTAVASMTAANYLGEETGASNSPVGKLLVKAGQAYMSGGENLAQEVIAAHIKEKTLNEGTRVLVRETGMDADLARKLAGAGISYASGGIKEVKSFAKDEVKKDTTKVISKETGIDSTIVGGVVEIGDAYATSVSNSPSDKSKKLNKDQDNVVNSNVPNRSQLSNDYKKSSFAGMGEQSTINAIQSNPSFSEKAKLIAEQTAKKVARKRANQILAAKTKGLVSLDKLESIYSLKDKNIEQIIQEAQKNAEAKLKSGYVKEKINAEMDREIARKIDKAYGLGEKYGQEMLMYLFQKYGPQYDYDQFIMPNDFLNFQFAPFPKQGERIFKINYFSKEKIFLGVIAVVGTAAIASQVV